MIKRLAILHMFMALAILLGHDMVIHHHEDAVEHHDDHDDDHESPFALAFSGFHHFANNKEEIVVPRLDSFRSKSNLHFHNYFINAYAFQAIKKDDPVPILYPDNPSPPFSSSYRLAFSFRGPPVSIA